MKKTLATLLMSLLAVYALPGYAAAATPNRTPAPTGRQFQSPPSSVTVRDGVETLTGEAAVEHLEELKGRQKKLFAQAERSMRERGYKATDAVLVQRTADGNRRTQESASDGDGELVWISWNDGDSATWEGTLLYENYSTGITTVYNAQVLLSALETLWEERIGSTGGGGGDRPEITELRPGAKHQPVAQIASGSRASAGLRSDIMLVQSADVGGFFRCANRGCMAALSACSSMGPYGMGCFVVICGGSMLFCAAVYLM